MHEIVINLHVHTTYSDGHGSYSEIIEAAMRAGIDAVLVADHNVLVCGPEDVYKNGDRRVLMLVGEEIHDQSRQPQKNHLLVIGAGRELATLAHDPPRLVEAIRQADGLAFLAHPVDYGTPLLKEESLEWVDWQLRGITGVEIWNGMSELKSLLKSMLHAFYYGYNPSQVHTGPFPEALRKWDEMLAEGRRVVGIGASDAHAIPAKFGPFRRVFYPYEFHFRSINTHLFLSSPLSGELEIDRKLILDALRAGRAFVGYDLPASTRGFRFSANGKDGTALMGEEVSCQSGVTFQIRLPRPTECRLIKDGKLVKTWEKRETCTYITSEPGIYRVEAYIDYLGKSRGWIFSNPIYARSNLS